MQKKNRSPSPHLITPDTLPLATDPNLHCACRRGPSRSWRLTLPPTPSTWKGRIRVSRHPPRRTRPTQSPKDGVDARIRRLGVQNCDSFCDPTRTLHPKAPVNFEAARKEPNLPPSVRFSFSLKTLARGGKPNCRKRIAPRLPTSLTRGRCRMPLTPNRTAPAGGHQVVRGG